MTDTDQSSWLSVFSLDTLAERILALRVAVLCLDKIREGIDPEALLDDDHRA
jgi:hypothetical protein